MAPYLNRIGFSREQLAFLGWTYELKSVADYGGEQPVPITAAQRAIDEAATLIEIVVALLPA